MKIRGDRGLLGSTGQANLGHSRKMERLYDRVVPSSTAGANSSHCSVKGTKGRRLRNVHETALS